MNRGDAQMIIVIVDKNDATQKDTYETNETLSLRISRWYHYGEISSQELPEILLVSDFDNIRPTVLTSSFRA
jgi:hypothetical protein